MNATYAPTSEIICVQTSAEAATTPFPITASRPGIQIRPASSFLTPSIFSWINTPYYEIPASLKENLINTLPLNSIAASESDQPAAESATQYVPQAPVAPAPEAANECVAQPTLEYAAETAPEACAALLTPAITTCSAETGTLDGFDLNKLDSPLLEVASESQLSHVQTVIAFLQKGGEGAKTFGKIFLNDLALQKTVMAGLMNEPGNPLSHIEFLHKELALRLAACSQARQVAQLILADI